MTDDLIAAYRTAVAEGDDDTRLRLAAALTQIGRHFATQVGPKAAGVVLNQEPRRAATAGLRYGT